MTKAQRRLMRMLDDMPLPRPRPCGTVAIGLEAPRPQTFISANTFVAPSNARSATVTVYGGGGSGGNVQVSANGGGGGGGYIFSPYIPLQVTPQIINTWKTAISSGGGSGGSPVMVVSVGDYKDDDMLKLYLGVEVAAVARRILACARDGSTNFVLEHIDTTLAEGFVLVCRRNIRNCKQIAKIALSLLRALAVDPRIKTKTRRRMVKKYRRLVAWFDLPVVDLLADLA
jgi:hypothetical protein